jgi:uncharacterized protein (DUF885 family)
MRPIEEFHDRAFIDLLMEAPELPLELGVDAVHGVRFPSDRFTGYTESEEERRRNRMAETMATLRRYPLSEQTPEQRLTSRVFEFFLEHGEGPLLGVRGHAFAHCDQPVRPGVGVQSELPIFLANLHPVNDRQGALDYVSRLSAFEPLFAGLVDGLERREARGNVLPRFLIERLVDELRDFVATDACDHLLYTAFASKLSDVPELDAAERRDFLARAERLLRGSVLPAYAKLLDFLGDQRQRAPEAAGLCRLPDGEAYYDFLLKGETTTDTHAEEIHSLGLREIETLKRRMNEGFAQLGYGRGSFEEKCHALEHDERFRNADTPMDRDRLVDQLQGIVDEMQASVESIFERLPRAGVAVEPVPSFAEARRHSNYRPPARDGSRPGIFEVNVRAALQVSRLSHRTLCYHETYPGHHLQLALVQERDDLPVLRRMVAFHAYIEGWAKYAETIPWEHDFDRDPHWNLARTRQELISTTNLALDTGIHHRGWTRDEGVRFFAENTGWGGEFAESIVDRIAATPAQTCSYKMGMRKFVELRDRMRGTLGDAFDIKHFHSSVLDHGALPLVLLDEVVDESIAAAKGGIG